VLDARASAHTISDQAQLLMPCLQTHLEFYDGVVITHDMGPCS
jgi:hypothetical protein